MSELQRIRIERGLSLRELARKASLDQSTISRLEQGHHLALATTVSKLAKALDVPAVTFADLVDTGAAERGRKGGKASSGVPKKDTPAPVHSRAGMSRKEAVLVEAAPSFS